MSEFSTIQMALFNFFEFKVRESALFKIREKVDKKASDIEKSSDSDKVVKQEQLNDLLQEQISIRKDALKTTIPEWLTASAEKAGEVAKPMLKVTHPTKFTHGMTPYSGIYVAAQELDDKYLMTTDKLGNRYFDIAMSNGNLITHGRFLCSNLDGKTVYEALEQNDIGWLSEFSADNDQIDQWAFGLKQWLGQSSAIEASRLKQIYFHNPKDDSYVLLSPLFSSALAQAVYERVRFARFNPENNQRRKARKNGKYADGELLAIPNIVIMNFGGTQPQNITVRNFERHGEVFLLPCFAPEWQSTLKPPINNRSIFMGEFSRRAWYIARELRDYLVDLQNDKSNIYIRKRVKRKVDQIIDVLLSYVSQVQALEEQAGWSEKATDLKFEHKLWLDVHNPNPEFQKKRREGEWQAVVCRDFGLWLNHKLEHKNAVFEAIESKHWAKLLKQQLDKLEREGVPA
jgi:CRISPR-associated protein Csy1